MLLTWDLLWRLTGRGMLSRWTVLAPEVVKSGEAAAQMRSQTAAVAGKFLGSVVFLWKVDLLVHVACF